MRKINLKLMKKVPPKMQNSLRLKMLLRKPSMMEKMQLSRA
jgi:hypothetical protein